MKVTETNEQEVLKAVAESKSMTPEEKEMVVGYFMRSKLGGIFGVMPANPLGKTVKQIIEEQKAYVAEEKVKEDMEKLLAKEAKEKEEALAAELRKSLSLAIYEKGFIPSNMYASRYDDYITIKAAYQNTSTKDIRAFQGTVIFQDLFGDVIFKSRLKITDPIKAGEKATWEGTIKYNQFSDEHNKLKNAELKDLKVIWAPQTIIFADGSRIGEDTRQE